MYSETGSLPPVVVKEFSIYQPPGPWNACEYIFAHGISSPSGEGKKRITAYPLPVLSTSGFQRRSSAPPPPALFIFSTSLTSLDVKEPSLDCFFRSEKDIRFFRLIGFGLCVPIIVQIY